ncbi:MAG TPA: type 1 glutamine amidotransferase domain-containing protein [Cellvibrio sp.]|nr:type 1 glutamine amidotransferase domain-containing protein [Cellvibrio sp.]
MKILMVLTSRNKLGNSQKATGIWLDEFAAPYFTFKDYGASVFLASPLGGRPPLDPNSDSESVQTNFTIRFRHDADAQNKFANTEKLENICARDYDGVFYPGGYGQLWDLSQSAASINLIEAMLDADKPVAAVCHAPAVLRYPKRSNGISVIHNKRVTGFSNSEETAMGMTEVVPFLIEDILKANGGNYSKANNWQPYIVVDGLVITGQNPASSLLAAKALLAAIRPGLYSSHQQGFAAPVNI